MGLQGTNWAYNLVYNVVFTWYITWYLRGTCFAGQITGYTPFFANSYPFLYPAGHET